MVGAESPDGSIRREPRALTLVVYFDARRLSQCLVRIDGRRAQVLGGAHLRRRVRLVAPDRRGRDGDFLELLGGMGERIVRAGAGSRVAAAAPPARRVAGSVLQTIVGRPYPLLGDEPGRAHRMYAARSVRRGRSVGPVLEEVEAGGSGGAAAWLESRDLAGTRGRHADDIGLGNTLIAGAVGGAGITAVALGVTWALMVLGPMARVGRRGRFCTEPAMTAMEAGLARKATARHPVRIRSTVTRQWRGISRRTSSDRWPSHP